MTGIDPVRHGQASFGADDDDRLSPLGEEQARRLGDWARECGFGIGRVALGTARRHRQSAERCLATPGSGPSAGDWIVEPGFDEFDHHDVLIRFRPELAEPGALGRGLARSDPPHRAFQHLFVEAVARGVGGVHDADYRESWRAFQQRGRAALDRLIAEGDPAREVWVFTSGGPMAARLQELFAIPDTRIFDLNWTLVNTGVTPLRGRPGRVSLGYLNSRAHLEWHRRSELITHR
jgi:broad specificity phosphatase PhoE